MRFQLSAWTAPLAAMVFTSVLSGATPAAQPVVDDMRAQLRDDARKQAEEAVSRNLIERLISSAQETSTLLGQCQQKAESLIPRLQNLLSDNDGKKIALDDTAFLNFMQLQDHPPTVLEDIKSKKQGIDTIIATLKQQLPAAAMGYVPPIPMKDEVDAAREWAINGFAQMTETAGWLDAVIAKAPKDADLTKAQTLKQRIDNYNEGKIDLLLKSRMAGELSAKGGAQQTVQDAARLATLIQAQAEADRLLRQANAQMERMRIEHEMQIKQLKEEQQQREDVLNKQLAEAKAARTVQDAKNEVIVTKAEQDADFLKKKQAAHEPDVARVLAPFLAKGYWQPRTGKGINSEPMSLKFAQAGALSPDKNGIELLMQCANSQANDRAHWGRFLHVSQAVGAPTNEQIETVKKAQGYLNELGEALVAEGMLAK